MHDCPGRVGEKAQMLGIAGLLPQVAAAAISAMDHGMNLGAMFALGYAGVLLSFIGGAWWGFAMHRVDGQGELAAIAVVPSLIGAAIILACIAGVTTLGWSLVLLGCAVMLTLPVDRRLVAQGDAPHGWLALRIPLSLALGTLTILTGALS